MCISTMDQKGITDEAISILSRNTKNYLLKIIHNGNFEVQKNISTTNLT